MDQIYASFADCDVIIFASPIYFWTITDSLKTAVDRLYAELECQGYREFSRERILIMTANGYDYSQAVRWYRTFERYIGWKNRGEILGRSKNEEAYNLEASLK